MPQREGTAIDNELYDWILQDLEKLRRLREAEQMVHTGSIEIHYHNGVARKIRPLPAPVDIGRKELTTSE